MFDSSGRMITFLLVVIFTLVMPVRAADYGGGSGEPNDPYQIKTAEQMNTIGLHSEDRDKHFILMADIDLGAYTGTQYNVIGAYRPDPGSYSFSGTFDGNGHKISNFTYFSPGAILIGLFGAVNDSGEIQNLGLISPNVDVVDQNDLSASGYEVGILAGFCSGTISGCYVEGGNISGNAFPGGLVGEISGTIIDCYTTCDVYAANGSAGGIAGFGDEFSTIISCHSSSNVTAERYLAGGLAGNCYGQILNCYATGAISGYSEVGGLIGSIGYDSIVSKCYSAGTVEGVHYHGGLVGDIWGGTISNCFWDTETSGRSDGVGGGSQSGVTGLTTEEMMGQNNFVSAGWDFLGESANGTEEIWTMCRWATYPLFSREVSPPGAVYYVDGAGGDDNNDGRSIETAFATIQKGIDTAWHDNTIIVSPGTYIENIDIGAKRFTLRSSDPNRPELTIIDGNDLDSVVKFVGSENADCSLAGFTITGGNASGNGGGIQGNFTGAVISNCIIKDNVGQGTGGGVSKFDGILEECVISGNSAKERGGGLIASSCSIVNCLIYDNEVGYFAGSTQGYGGAMYNCNGATKNCTIAFNRASNRAGGLDGCSGTITNSIIWGNEFEELLNCSVPSYSCIQDWSGGGFGNINDNPLFADAVLSDPNRRDFHLQSTAGRWDPDTETWAFDSVTSPCIDTGNPGYPLSSELNDATNVRINMGAWGGTTEAGRTPPGWGLLADLSNDGTVDYTDLAQQADDWKQSGDYLPGDLNRDGSVDLPDVVLLAYNWLSVRYAN